MPTAYPIFLGIDGRPMADEEVFTTLSGEIVWHTNFMAVTSATTSKAALFECQSQADGKPVCSKVVDDVELQTNSSIKSLFVREVHDDTGRRSGLMLIVVSSGEGGTRVSQLIVGKPEQRRQTTFSEVQVLYGAFLTDVATSFVGIAVDPSDQTYKEFFVVFDVSRDLPTALPLYNEVPVASPTVQTTSFASSDDSRSITYFKQIKGVVVGFVHRLESTAGRTRVSGLSNCITAYNQIDTNLKPY